MKPLPVHIPIDLVLYHLHILLLESQEPSHRDLADALLRAIDFRAVADQWSENDDVAHGVFLVLRDGSDYVFDKHIMVARRLIETALLLVGLGDEQREAATLLFDAAGRLAGLADDTTRDTVLPPANVNTDVKVASDDARRDGESSSVPSRTFKVGDDVVFARRSKEDVADDGYTPPIGWSGKIIDIDDSKEVPILVKGPRWSFYWFHPSSLDLVTAAP